MDPYAELDWRAGDSFRIPSPTPAERDRMLRQMVEHVRNHEIIAACVEQKPKGRGKGRKC